MLKFILLIAVSMVVIGLAASWSRAANLASKPDVAAVRQLTAGSAFTATGKFAGAASSTAQGDQARSRVILTVKNIKTLMPHFIAEAAKQISELPRDTTVFHWTNPDAILPTGQVTGPIDHQITEYLGKYTARYWSAGDGGQGLYFAEDPLSSTYAGTTLLQVTLAAKTKFVVSTKSSFFSDEALKELQSFGYQIDVLENLGNLFTLYQEPELLKVVARYFKIKFLIYAYAWQALPRGCRPQMGQLALIVFDDSAFVRLRSAVYDSRFKTIPAFEKSATLLTGFLDSVNVEPPDFRNRGITTTSFSSSVLQKVLNEENHVDKSVFQQWAKSFLFDCAW